MTYSDLVEIMLHIEKACTSQGNYAVTRCYDDFCDECSSLDVADISIKEICSQLRRQIYALEDGEFLKSIAPRNLLTPEDFENHKSTHDTYKDYEDYENNNPLSISFTLLVEDAHAFLSTLEKEIKTKYRD